MQQTVYFLLNLFCAGAFIMFLYIGLLFCFRRKPLAEAKELQKKCGGLFLLVALHIFYIHYGMYTDNPVIMDYTGLVLVTFDVLAAIYTIIALFRHTRNSTTEDATVEEETEIAPIVTESRPVVKASHTSKPLHARKSKKEAETEKENEVEDINSVEQISIDDLIFFQKVEALMTQKRLFSNPAISRDSIAAEIGTNRTHLMRSIKNATGKTFLEYITDMRTNYAATLLTTTDTPLDSIGSLVGFRSKSAYYRAFSAAFNSSPSEYRRRSRH